MSKWIERLKDIKNTVPDSKSTYSQATITATPSRAKDSTEAIRSTLFDNCVPDGIEASSSSLDTSIGENTRNAVPDESNLPDTEVSSSRSTLLDTSQSKHQGVKLKPLPDTVPRLPFALERLVSAASNDLLSGFTFDGVPDINNYVRALACDCLIGDQQHARDRLHQVQTARELSR